jgi:immune inhibitor A
MKQLSDSELLSNFLHVQQSAKLSDDGERCLIPPHPALKERLIAELERLKNTSNDNIISNKLTLGPNNQAGFNDGLIYPGNTFELGTPLGVARSAAAVQAPLRGALNILVVLVEFPGMPMQTPPQHFQDLFFSTKVVATGSVNEYYQEVTNSLISIQGQVLGPIMMPHPLSYYANNASGTGNSAPNARNLAYDTAAAVGALFNYAPFDNNKDGYVDAFVVVHAGPGAEVTGSTGDIWSHKWVLPSGAYPASGTTKVYGYLTVPEDCRLGVCAHELGHLLFGFPDLYDTTYTSNGVGDWCLMGGGSWNNNGLTPAHPNAWCKCNQNWVKINNPTTNQTIVIKDVKSGFEVFKLWKNGRSGSEYFLAENRQRAKFDSHLPGDGLLVWHVDESIPDNSNKAHFKVALLQADGLKQLEMSPAPGTSGDDGDPYPGSTHNTNLTAATNPNTLSYAGLNTSVQITNISIKGHDIKADLTII